eukprot:5513441-Lingulodinium_polyedra.AAC.1
MALAALARPRRPTKWPAPRPVGRLATGDTLGPSTGQQLLVFASEQLEHGRALFNHGRDAGASRAA